MQNANLRESGTPGKSMASFSSSADSGPACDIFNGARCGTYSWSQGHGDLEIRVKLPDAGIAQTDVEVKLQNRDIIVRVIGARESALSNAPWHPVCGRLERQVDTKSAYWMVDKDTACLIIYLDKTEESWWTRLLVHEQPLELGPKNYSVPMDQLDEGARMAVDKLITEQRRKLIQGPQ